MATSINLHSHIQRRLLVFEHSEIKCSLPHNSHSILFDISFVAHAEQLNILVCQVSSLRLTAQLKPLKNDSN
jgi:hypothetical protein